MNKKNWIIPMVIAMFLSIGSISGCVSAGENGQGISAIEEMTNLEYNRWQLYISLAVKIGANQLLESKLVTEEELDLAATALDIVRDQTVYSGASSFITPALKEVGLDNDEIELLLLVVEQELLARGALNWTNADGVVSLSPRTIEILTITSNSLRAAMVVTPEEVTQGSMLQVEFE